MTPAPWFPARARAGLVLLAVVAARAAPAPAPGPAALRFQFGPGTPPPGWVAVGPSDDFSPGRGYGFEPGPAPRAVAGVGGAPGAVASAQPFYFSARVPAEGNYRVRVTVGDPGAAAVTTIKAELRRLLVERVETAPGQFTTVMFIVNTRRPAIRPGPGIPAGVVRLKAPRESGPEAWAWDDLLTLEFDNAHPAVSAVEITPAAVPTVFLIGDSTVCDQPAEPYASWGQMLPRFFRPDLAVANHAESGETYRDSIGRRRLDKILSLMQPGDYLFMQFGHNDQKQIAAGTGGPFTTYQAELKKHVDGARAHGGIPVIVSPMERRAFDAHGKVIPSLADYAAASRQAAAELGVAFIDLNRMSQPFYEALEAQGPEFSRRAFAGRDDTHHNNYGSYELAKCVLAGIRQAGLPLAAEIVDNFHGFDPAQPDPVDTFAVPPSPRFTNERPLGDEAQP